MPKLPLKVERSAALSVLVIVVLTASVAALTPMAVAQSAANGQETIADKVAAARIVSQPIDKAAYVLGSQDRLSIRVFGTDDLPDRPTEIGADGTVNLPMVGKVQAAGLSVRSLETELNHRYGAFFKDPEVSVSVTDYRSQPVTVVGAVNMPNVIQLHGPTRLMEVISQAGGLKPDAGDKVMITSQMQFHKDSSAAADPNSPDARFSIKEIDLRKIIDGTDPSANVVVEANDLITVPKAKMIYVVGDVGKPGGYILDGHSSTLSVLQAIALAGGVNKTAAASNARILRSTVEGNSHRTEDQINLKKILASKSPDISLRADDILFVPDSNAKNAGLRALQMAADVGTGLAIWRF